MRLRDDGEELVDAGPARHSGVFHAAARKSIAERIRLLIGEHPIAEVAQQLHVGVDALHDAIDETMPAHTVQVLAAVSHTYGVDPTWLLTGVYNSETHRATANHRDHTEEIIRSLLLNPSPPSP